MRARVLALALMAAACPGLKEHPPEPWIPGELLVGRAASTHEDRYAGFQLDIPDGWVRFSNSGIYSYAPVGRLAAHPEVGNWAGAETFTVLVIAHQDETLDESVERSRGSNEGEDGSWVEADGRVAGRRARTLLHRPPEKMRLPQGGCACVDRYTNIQWSEETVLLFMIHAGSVEVFERLRAEADRVLASLRPGPVDDRAAALRTLLERRILGNGAEEFLTSKSDRAYRRYGLYTIDDETGQWVTEYSVQASLDRGGRTTFHVSVGLASVSGGETGRTEGIDVGFGEDRRGAKRDGLVLDMMEIQAPGTS